MLKLKDLCFFYRKEEIFFENLDLDLSGGSILGIYGPSGSGKTSLLKIIGGLIEPKEGKVIFDGKDIFSFPHKQLSAYRKQEIGFAFQEFNLLEGFSSSENINMHFFLGQDIGKDKERENYLVNFLGVQDILNKKIENISGGEKERISIIKSLIHKPSVLLMDEPTNYLDEKNSEKVYKLIKEYSKENLCIIVSHENESKNKLELKEFKKNRQLSFFSNNL